MEKEKLLGILENGKQIGISKIIKNDTSTIAYTYAIQKQKENYIVYIDEYNLDTAYEDEMERSTEQIFTYDNLSDCMSHFAPKYNIQFEDLHISKGQKFFNIEFAEDL